MERVTQYELLEKIGKGSFGEVYKAFAKETGEIVAIKIVDLSEGEELLDEVNQEIQVLKECCNPLITNFHESFKHNSRLYIVMEYVAGGSIKDIIRSRGPIQEIYIPILLRELLKATSFLHANNKIHRDIKAANILLSMEGEVKLADFGVAAKITESVSKRNSFVGTPYWMAPEVISQSLYDTKADIWSIGITAYELAYACPPHNDLQPINALFRIQTGPSPQLDASFSVAFREFVSLCLQKDPSMRPDAEALLGHKFIKSAKKTYYLTDLLDSSTILKREHFRSYSTQEPVDTVLKLSETTHRHSHSSGSTKFKYSHRKNSSNASSSNSVRTTVGVPEEDSISWLPCREPSFLTILETAVANCEASTESIESLEKLILAVAELEIRDSRLAPRLFSEVMKLYKQNYP